LTSGYAAQRVSGSLEHLLGAPVRVAAVDIGLSGSSVLHGLQLLEVDAPDQPAWLTVERIHADLSVPDLLGHAPMPRQVVLTGASLALRFDQANQLLTRLPHPTPTGQAWPRIRLENSQLSLEQEGLEGPFILRGLRAELTPTEGGLQIQGRFAVDDLGDWGLRGQIDPASGTATLDLECPSLIHLTQAHLQRVPFVSPTVWKQIQDIDGRSAVTLRLRHRGGEQVKYRVEMRAEETKVQVASIHLETTGTRGRIIIEDGLVELRDVQGETAGGQIATTGDLDFRQPVHRLNFHVNVQHVDLHRLPALWHLPKQTPGRVSGQADLQLTVIDGRVHTSGKGEGKIEAGRLAIPLRLRAEDNHFRFIPQLPRDFPRPLGLPRIGSGTD
jgi:hypothetical protein